MSKQQQLEEIAEKILADDVTPELKASATQLVIGEGDPNADVVFIGEAPGKNEDEQGRPFVGAAGKFLTEMIESLGWQRSDVYITNIIKYRPPGNRDPKSEEVTQFIPYLTEQIKVIEPKLIATLGRFSMEVFLPGQKISKVHGQPKRKNGQVFLPLYHPAVALYNANMKGVLFDDMRKIPKIIEKINNNKKAKSQKTQAAQQSKLNL